MFHIRLKQKRLQAGLSQKQIAEYLSISPQSVSKWENGLSLPSIDYLPRLAKCLSCDVNAFFIPTEAPAVDSNTLLELLGMMVDAIYTESCTFDDIVAFEKEHPSSIDALLEVLNEISTHKTIQHKTLDGLLNCSEEEVTEFLKLLEAGKSLEQLDIPNTYYVIKDALDGMVILFNFCKTILEVSPKDSPSEFLTAFKAKLGKGTQSNDVN